MHSPISLLTSYVLEKIEGEPAAKRAELYAALAELSPTDGERSELMKLSAECAAVAATHKQLTLKFRRRSGNGSNEQN